MRRGLAKLGVAGLLLVTGCALLFPNLPPVATFSVSPLIGISPLRVTFDAGGSQDPDGTIRGYAWEIGDGATGTGSGPTHQYTVAALRTFVVKLVVTDDDGATDETTRTLRVLPAGEVAGNTAPIPAILADPIAGNAPLAVSFDGRTSSDPNGAIAAYLWDFGDGETAEGATVTHRYEEAGTYIVNLVVTDNLGAPAQETTVIQVAKAGTFPDELTAAFDVNATTIVAPLRLWVDPSGSGAPSGDRIVRYTWDFGDGSATVETTAPEILTHRYVTDQASQARVVVLTVEDDNGKTHAASQTITVVNRAPIAGFVVDLNADRDGNPTDWEDPDTADLVVSTPASTHRVFVKSENPDNWSNAVPADPDTVDPPTRTGTPAGGGARYEDHSFSYDPEGQGWGATGVDDPPEGFPSVAWGIAEMAWTFGDGETETVDLEDADGPDGLWHDYDLPASNLYIFEITVTVRDYLGAEASFSREIRITRN